MVGCGFVLNFKEEGETLLAPSAFMKTGKQKTWVSQKVFSSKHKPRSSSLFSLYEHKYRVPEDRQDITCLVNCSVRLNLTQAGHRWR